MIKEPNNAENHEFNQAYNGNRVPFNSYEWMGERQFSLFSDNPALAEGSITRAIKAQHELTDGTFRTPEDTADFTNGKASISTCGIYAKQGMQYGQSGEARGKYIMGTQGYRGYPTASLIECSYEYVDNFTAYKPTPDGTGTIAPAEPWDEQAPIQMWFKLRTVLQVEVKYDLILMFNLTGSEGIKYVRIPEGQKIASEYSTDGITFIPLVDGTLYYSVDASEGVSDAVGAPADYLVSYKDKFNIDGTVASGLSDRNSPVFDSEHTLSVPEYRRLKSLPRPQFMNRWPVFPDNGGTNTYDNGTKNYALSEVPNYNGGFMIPDICTGGAQGGSPSGRYRNGFVFQTIKEDDNSHYQPGAYHRVRIWISGGSMGDANTIEAKRLISEGVGNPWYISGALENTEYYWQFDIVRPDELDPQGRMLTGWLEAEQDQHISDQYPPDGGKFCRQIFAVRSYEPAGDQNKPAYGLRTLTSSDGDFWLYDGEQYNWEDSTMPSNSGFNYANFTFPRPACLKTNGDESTANVGLKYQIKVKKNNPMAPTTETYQTLNLVDILSTDTGDCSYLTKIFIDWKNIVYTGDKVTPTLTYGASQPSAVEVELVGLDSELNYSVEVGGVDTLLNPIGPNPITGGNTPEDGVLRGSTNTEAKDPKPIWIGNTRLNDQSGVCTEDRTWVLRYYNGSSIPGVGDQLYIDPELQVPTGTISGGIFQAWFRSIDGSEDSITPTGYSTLYYPPKGFMTLDNEGEVTVGFVGATC